MKKKKELIEQKKGQKIATKYCPHCTDEQMVRLKNGDIEVFECVNCKFRVRKK